MSAGSTFLTQHGKNASVSHPFSGRPGGPKPNNNNNNNNNNNSVYNSHSHSHSHNRSSSPYENDTGDPLDESVADALRPGPPSKVRGKDKKVSQSTLLAHKLREMERVQDQLELKKGEYHDRMKTCRAGEGVLSQKQSSIRASVVQFDKFVKDNDQKRRRANQRAKDESAVAKQKMKDIESLKGKLAELVAQKEASETLLKRDEMYYQYFTKVCDFDKHATWESNEAIINRYDILEAANADLVSVAAQHDKDIEQLKRALLEYTKTQTDEILFLNNQLTREQSRLDALRNDAGHLEHKNSVMEEVGNDKTRLLGQVRMAIANIHARAKPKIAVHRSNLAEMLEEIKVRLSDLIYIERHSNEGKINVIQPRSGRERKSLWQSSPRQGGGGQGQGQTTGSATTTTATGSATGTNTGSQGQTHSQRRNSNQVSLIHQQSEQTLETGQERTARTDTTQSISATNTEEKSGPVILPRVPVSGAITSTQPPLA